MSESESRNLLFGFLAQQLDFINNNDLISAIKLWITDKSKRLEDFISTKKLDADSRELLTRLVAKHIALHGNDFGASLAAAIPEHPEILEVLSTCDDLVLNNSLLTRNAQSQTDQNKSSSANHIHDYKSESRRFVKQSFHAKGGLGEVSIAKDTELNREVAFKEIREEYADNSEYRIRFVLEAEITGSLEHPGIVPVYGLNQDELGRPYYAMRFIRGESLKDTIEKIYERKADGSAGQNTASNTPAESKEVDGPAEPNADRSFTSLRTRRLLQKLIDVCNAINYAHSRGILHRDIKPSNIMLGKYGETLMVDWGLAKPLCKDAKPLSGTDSSIIHAEKRLEPKFAEHREKTVQGRAMGTPAYMSPEQASGHIDQLGPASDVYSLGATLYHLLTGEPPTAEHTLNTNVENAPHRSMRNPRSINPQLPKTLEAICLKAMNRDSQHRYQSAAELADDLDRFLADEPTKAFTEPLVVRVKRLTRRYPRSFATAVASSLLGLVFTTAFAQVIATKNNTLNETNSKLSETNKNLEQSIAAEKRSNLLAQQGLYNLQLTLAQKSMESAPDEALRWLEDPTFCPEERRDFAWHLFHRWASKDRVSWNAHTGIVTYVGFVEGNRQLITCGVDGQIKEWDINTQQELRSDAFGIPILCAVLHPQSPQIAFGDANGIVRIWDFSTHTVVDQFKLLDAPVVDLVYYNNSDAIAGISSQKMAAFSVKDREFLRNYTIPTGRIRAIASNPHKPELFIGGIIVSIESKLDLFDLPRKFDGGNENGIIVRFSGSKLEHLLDSPPLSGASVSALEFTPDGNSLVAASTLGRLVRINCSDFTVCPMGESLSHLATTISVSPVDGTVATAFIDDVIFTEDKPGRLEVDTDTDTLGSWFSQNSTSLTALQEKPFFQKLELWHVGGARQIGYVPNIEGDIASLSHSPDGCLLATGNGNGLISVIDIRPACEQMNLVLNNEEVRLVEFSADGKDLLVNGRLRWNLQDGTTAALSGDPTRKLEAPGSLTHTSLNNEVFRQSITQDQLVEIAGTLGVTTEINGAISSDGKLAAIYERLNAYDINMPVNLWLWDLENRSLLQVLKGHGGAIYDAVFSPNDGTLASCGFDQTIKLWDTLTGSEIYTIRSHRSSVFSLAFAPDGKRLASGSFDKTAKVWSIDATEASNAPWPVKLQNLRPVKRNTAPKYYPAWSLKMQDLSSMAHNADVTATFAESLEPNESVLEQLVQYFMSVSEYYLSINRTWMFAEARENAAKYIEQIKALRDDADVDILYVLADTYNNLTETYNSLEESALSEHYGELAVRHYEELLPLLPNDMDVQVQLGGALNNLAMALEKLGQYTLALSKYERAIKLQEHVLDIEPDNITAQLFLANHHLNSVLDLRQLRRFDEALAVLDEVESSSSATMQHLTQVFLNRADIAIEDPAKYQDQLSKKLAAYLNSLRDAGIDIPQYDSDHPVAKVLDLQNQRALRIACRSDATPDEQKNAEQYSRHALALRPNDLNYQAVAAAIQFRLGNVPEATVQLENLFNANPYMAAETEALISVFYAMTNTTTGAKEKADLGLKRFEDLMTDPEIENREELQKLGSEARDLINPRK